MMKYTVTLFAVLALVGCNAGPNRTNIEVIQNMMDQVSIKSQDWDPKQGDAGQMRLPPEGAIARGQEVYKYMGDPAGAATEKNPLGGDMSPETLTMGRKYYEIYCSVCHGATGAGEGLVAEKMSVKPRNLITADAKGYSDGRIYYAITAGIGVMGAYSSQIPEAKKRWAIVNYVRSLQK